MVTACDIYKGLDFTLYALRFPFLLSTFRFHFPFLLSVSSFHFPFPLFVFCDCNDSELPTQLYTQCT